MAYCLGSLTDTKCSLLIRTERSCFYYVIRKTDFVRIYNLIRQAMVFLPLQYRFVCVVDCKMWYGLKLTSSMSHMIFSFNRRCCTAGLFIVEVIWILHFSLLHGLGSNLPFQANQKQHQPPCHNRQSAHSPDT